MIRQKLSLDKHQTVTTNINSDKDDVHEENGALFWINRSGIPLDKPTWERMWEHVARVHPEGVAMTKKIRNQKDLPEIAVPQAPLTFPSTVPIPERLQRIQKYMSGLEYNHTGTQFFEIRRIRPVAGLMECAKEMIREALPIKCLEAVILGIYLTNGMLGLERFPISFKTIFSGTAHHHVVLGVYYGGRYGAIGMSRRDDLMYKTLTFKSLSDLVFDFERSYKNYWHDLVRIKVGMAVSHDQHSYEVINWKALALNLRHMHRKELTRDLEVHSRYMRAKAQSLLLNTYVKNVTPVHESSSAKENLKYGRSVSPIRVARSKSLGVETNVKRPTPCIGDKLVDKDLGYQIGI
ncbi:LOW QUALITY PROTEIN: vasohibin-2-like [Pomacea canaliculata]|uniref:LOW QUALITY PROTEIN: vasohibin-2-like n=1 Tax=Pomacea canaliculata TaxID=400727 RepID=UPI000D73EC6C|nr:LOW QUALITY PROTEIN: vasohibin-2-like [Pomacea canaliculata]